MVSTTWSSCSVFLRRFSDSFGQLLLERLQLKRSRNPERLEDFENGVFSWPVKEELDLVAGDSGVPLSDGDHLDEVLGNHASAGGDGNEIQFQFMINLVQLCSFES